MTQNKITYNEYLGIIDGLFGLEDESVITDAWKAVKDRIRELEQENARLREAAQAVLDDWHDPHAVWAKTGALFNNLKQALEE